MTIDDVKRELADKAASIRSRVSRASAQSQHIMRAEAAAYERCLALLEKVDG